MLDSVIGLLLATRNAHKIAEIRAILGNSFDYLSLKDFPQAPNVVEDAGTFEGNATKKAVELAKWFSQKGSMAHDRAKLSSLFVLADDSGLEVDALNGEPGVHSARFAALDSGHSSNSPDAENNAKLLGLLEAVPLQKRTARFRCVLALTPTVAPARESTSPVCYADEAELGTQLFEGVCEGRIAFAPAGSGGFGYDPLFLPQGYHESFAELGQDIKNQLSHRARALARLKESLLRIC
jgi:XTP/dITP diphosphohydrolase